MATKAPATKAPATKAPVVNKCSICGKPLAPNNTSGIGSTCKRHVGKVGKHYTKVQAQPQSPKFITVVQLCNAAQKLGKSRGYAVRLTGGNAGTLPPVAPIFTVYQHGRRKYVKAGAIAAMQAIAKGKQIGQAAPMFLFVVGCAALGALAIANPNGGFVNWAKGVMY